MKYQRPTDVPQPSQGSWKYLPQAEVFGATNEATLQADINAWLLSNVAQPYTVYIHDIKLSTTGANGPNVEYSALVHYTITQAD